MSTSHHCRKMRVPVRGFAIIMQDATERRKIAIVLEEARQERARLQEKLLSHVSHELRTPLTAIYFFTTNVLDGLHGDLTPDQHEHLTFALDNVKQLKNMVSDLLDITRVETHKLTVEPQHVSPGQADCRGSQHMPYECGSEEYHLAFRRCAGSSFCLGRPRPCAANSHQPDR